jgi:hypothetical protein
MTTVGVPLPPTVKSTCIVVLHWPEPETTFSLT